MIPIIPVQPAPGFRPLRWLNVALRSIHLVAVIHFSASILGALPASASSGIAVFLSGSALWAVDLLQHPDHLRQMAGFSMLLKLALIAGMIVSPSLRLPLFWTIVVWSVIFAHDLSLGFRGSILDTYNPVNNSTLTLGKANLNNPQAFAEPNYTDFTNRYHLSSATQKALIVGDTLTINPQWGVLLSGSQSYLASTNYSKTGALTSQSNDQGFSGAASLTYKPWQPLMLYATYADSLQQGDAAPTGASNVGTILAPYRSKQKEVGAKWSLDQINLTLAGFRIERPYAYVQNGTYALGGTQVNHGIEFMADGNIGKQLTIFGGVTWLDPKLHNTGDSTTENQQIVGLAKITANLLTIYHVAALPGVDLNANVHYVGKRPTDNANLSWVKAYTTFDLGGSYTTKLGQHVDDVRLYRPVWWWLGSLCGTGKIAATNWLGPVGLCC